MQLRGNELIEVRTQLSNGQPSSVSQLTPVSSLGQVSIPALYNANPTYMMNWRQAMADVMSGNAHRTVAYIGDSLPVGSYSDGNIAGLWNQAPPARLAFWLTKFGVTAGSASSLNNHALDNSGTLTNFNHWDSRVSVGAGWASDPTAGDEAPGGFWWSNSTTTNSWAFTPGVAFDSVDVSYVQFPGLGSFSIDIDGSALQTINSSGAAGIQVATVNKGSAGTTVNIKRVSGSIFMQGPIAYQNATKEVHVVNYGDNNSFTALRLANMSATQNAATTGAKLTIFSLGYHDIVDAGRTQDQLLTDLGTCIKTAQTIGDVLLTCYNPFNPATLSLTTQQIIHDTIVTAGINNNCWVIDNGPIRNTSYSAYNTAGMIGGDPQGLHPNFQGIDDFARFTASVLVKV